MTRPLPTGLCSEASISATSVSHACTVPGGSRRMMSTTARACSLVRTTVTPGGQDVAVAAAEGAGVSGGVGVGVAAAALLTARTPAAAPAAAGTTGGATTARHAAGRRVYNKVAGRRTPRIAAAASAAPLPRSARPAASIPPVGVVRRPGGQQRRTNDQPVSITASSHQQLSVVPVPAAAAVGSRVVVAVSSRSVISNPVRQ